MSSTVTGSTRSRPYVGNQITHNFSLARYRRAVMAAVPRMYSAGTIDTWPRNVAAVLMYGNPWLMPVPDLERTDYFLCLGANPQASNGSLFVCPDVVGQFAHIRGRGGKVVVVDPRRTGTAEHADEWIAIRPGSDAAFLFALLQVLFAEDRVGLGSVASIVEGVEVVRAVCASFTPEHVEQFTGVPAPTTRRIARELANARLGSDLRKGWTLQPGVRHPRVLAHRRGGDLHRQPRPGRGPHVPEAVPQLLRAHGRNARVRSRAVRPLAQSRQVARRRSSVRCLSACSRRRSSRPVRDRSVGSS